MTPVNTAWLYIALARENGGKAGSYPVSSLLAEGSGEGGMNNNKKSMRETAIEVDLHNDKFNAIFAHPSNDVAGH